MFPTARAIGYLPPESAWVIAGLYLTGGLDAYLSGIARVAAAFDDFRDFAIPSELTDTHEGTYDGLHYSSATNAIVAAALMADKADPGIDWHGQELAAITELYHRHLDQFIATVRKTKHPSS
jgi:hypothetical protein